MIKHIVMWTLKDFGSDKEKSENLLKMKSEIESLPEKIKEIDFSAEVGINYNHSERAYDIVLISEFNSNEELDKYRVHPIHKEVVESINSIIEKVAVVDFEV